MFEITLRSETGTLQGQQHQRGVQEVPKHDWSAELPDHASEVRQQALCIAGILKNMRCDVMRGGSNCVFDQVRSLRGDRAHGVFADLLQALQILMPCAENLDLCQRGG